ncbi:hypothetical protein NKG94_27650 [Micromonospora sp. M12]
MLLAFAAVVIEEQDLNGQIRDFVRRQVVLAELPAAAIVVETMEYLTDEAGPAETEAEPGR